MRKVSTPTVKATKNFPQHKLTIGLDLGGRSSRYCLLDEVGKVLLEQKLGMTPKSHARVVRCHAAQPDRTRNRDAFALDQSLAPRVGA
jgi:hypothetical protein